MVHAVLCRLRRMAGGSHRAIVLTIAALIPILVTCDSSPTEPEDPTSVEAQAKDLFPSGSTRVSALAQIADIREQVNRGETAQARVKVLALVDFLMTAFREGKLAGGTSAAAGNAASDLIDDLFTMVGLDPPNLPDGALSEDGTAKVVGPQGGEVVTPSGAAGVEVPAGAFDQSVLVTVTQLPTPPAPGTGPLPTALKQYGPYYDFATYPHVAQFGSAMRVGVCQVTDPSSPFYPPEPHERLRLAHTVGAGIEILDRVGVDDFIRCTNVSASVAPRHGWRGALSALARGVIGRITPASAYAAHGGLGGKVKSFSPFGAVDPAVSTVTVTLASPMVAGNTNQATAVLKDADGNVLIDRVITWTSSNEALATVSSTGLVTGVAEGGPVTITATSEGQSGSALLTVTPAPVALVTVSPLAPTVNTGETVQLSATTKDSHGNVLTGRAITWTSGNNSLATVSSSGLVSGIVEGGPVTITATSEGQSGTSSVTVTPAPVALVTVSPSSPTVNAGETVQLTATTVDAHANALTGRVITWTSSDEGLATVSSSGLVTGVAEGGPVTITATSEGQSGTADLTVTPAPVALVTVSPSSSTVNVGETLELTAATEDAQGNVLTGRVVTWTSSDESLATVSSSGLVTGVGEGGPVTITATSEGQSGTAQVTVTPAPVALVTVSPSSPTVNAGATVQLTATTKDANGNVLTGRAVNWTSSNNALATVSSSGLVTGVAEGGPVTITATSEGQSGTAQVTVNPAPVALVTVSPSSSTINVGATVQLTATLKDANGNVLTGRVVSWISSNNALATVSSSGLVTGVAEGGPLTITASSEGQNGTAAVTVTPAPVASVTVSPASPTTIVGTTTQLTATTKDASANVLTGRAVTWTSSNNALATVSSSGLVTGVAVGGPVTITATSEGKSGTATVTVTPIPVATVTVTPASPTINVAATVQLTATTKDAGANVLTGRVVTWSSSNNALATVSSSGLVTGVAAGGPVTITATSEGKSGTASVTVTLVPVATVTVSPASPTVFVGATVQLTATTKDASSNVLTGRVITWTSNNEALATVSSSGLVTGVAVGGPVTITATSEGQSGTTSLTVTLAPVATVTVSPATPSVIVGLTVQLSATTKDASNNVLTGRVITWTSSNEALATVSSSGLVTGVAVGGPVTITATSEGQSGTASVTVTPVPVATVTVSPASPTINVGATVQLTATTKDAGNNVLTGRVITWLSSNEALATVSASGLVTGVAAGGPVTITATSEGQSGTASVTITLVPVATVTVSPASPTVFVGATVQLTATTKDASSNVLTGRVITWASNNEALATVSSSGLVTGVAEGGPVTITATSEGQSGTASVTVALAPVATVTVSPATPSVTVGLTVQLSATTKDASNNVLTGRVITWTSSNEALATVSASGLVTGVAVGGPVTITATSEGQSGTASVTVSPVPVATVTVSPASPTITVGATVQLTATTKDANENVLTGRVITWTSSNEALATVSSSGLVTGVAEGGPVTITATSEGQSGTAAVTVTLAPVATVTVSPASPTVNVGATVQLTATTKDASENVLTGRVITWTSSNEALATVSSTGLVTGVAAGGPVTITATSEGQSGTAAVTVLSPIATTLYATDGNGGNLLSVNASTGAGTIIGSLGIGVVPALAVDPTTGIVYAGGGAGTPSFYTVDTTTGAATFVGSTGLGVAAISGLTFRSDGVLFAAVNIAGDGGTGADHLATINKTTGAATIVGPFGTCTAVVVPSTGGGTCTIEGIEGIAFDASGTLFGSHSQRGRAGAPGLYSINTTTGTSTFLHSIVDGSANPPSGGVVGLAFAPNGTLFGGTARAIAPATDGGYLVTINPATGVFTPIGAATAGSSLAGLAFR